MTKIINNNTPADTESATNFLLGISIAILVILAIWFFGRPYLGGAQTNTPSENTETSSPRVESTSPPSPEATTQPNKDTNVIIPEEINLNVNNDEEDSDQATMKPSAQPSSSPAN